METDIQKKFWMKPRSHWVQGKTQTFFGDTKNPRPWLGPISISLGRHFGGSPRSNQNSHGPMVTRASKLNLQHRRLCSFPSRIKFNTDMQCLITCRYDCAWFLLDGCDVFSAVPFLQLLHIPTAGGLRKESHSSGTREVSSLPLFNLLLFQPWKNFQSHSIWMAVAPPFLKRTGKEDFFTCQEGMPKTHKCRGPETSGHPAWRTQRGKLPT